MPKSQKTGSSVRLLPEVEKQYQKVRFLRNILLAGLVFSTTYFLLVLLPNPEMRRRLGLPVAGLFGMLLFGLVLLRLGRVKFASYFVVFSLWVVTTTIFASGGGLKLATFGTGYATVILTAGIFLGSRTAFGVVAACILSGLLLAYGETIGWVALPPAYTAQDVMITQSMLFVLIAYLLHTATGSIADALSRARRELTERRRVEGERESLIGELEVKNAELERFTFTVSHDLKSPLVTMQGFLGYLEKDFRDGDASRLQR